jgi:hypothetical protein
MGCLFPVRTFQRSWRLSGGDGLLPDCGRRSNDHCSGLYCSRVSCTLDLRRRCKAWHCHTRARCLASATPLGQMGLCHAHRASGDVAGFGRWPAIPGTVGRGARLVFSFPWCAHGVVAADRALHIAFELVHSGTPHPGIVRSAGGRAHLADHQSVEHRSLTSGLGRSRSRTSCTRSRQYHRSSARRPHQQRPSRHEPIVGACLPVCDRAQKRSIQYLSNLRLVRIDANNLLISRQKRR